MKSFNKIMVIALFIIAAVFCGANLMTSGSDGYDGSRPYRVEIKRICDDIEKNGFESIDRSRYNYVKNVEKRSGDEDFYSSEYDYVIREINGELYRFDYKYVPEASDIKLQLNVSLIIMAAVTLSVMVYVKIKIIAPFDKLKDVPYELSKGNLTVPLKESKNRFFGKFTWGIDLLRETLEQRRQKELDLHKEKKTLLLSLSHDVKTPLSAIKLSSKALSRGLYPDKEKQKEVAENICAKADEIECYINQIVSAAREDFLDLQVSEGEFYLSGLIGQIEIYYKEKMALAKTEFTIADHSDHLIHGDSDRAVEVIQNFIENAMKYGDGKFVRIEFSEEDDCQLITVVNSGCSLPHAELPHIFDSFWRGSNSGNAGGSGLGLYICRQLMNKMGGEAFANIEGDIMKITAVFRNA